MGSTVIALGAIQLNAQMKTDAYTGCRGVGRIAGHDRQIAGHVQAKGAAVKVEAIGNKPC
jgi:hypothetical protein